MAKQQRKLKGHDPDTVQAKRPVFMIYGKGGVGKTWASLDFPNVYYVDTEGGASGDHYRKKLKDSGGCYFGPEDGSNDFAVLLEEVITLATTDHPFKTLVIDSYSKLFGTAIDMEYERMQQGGRDMNKTFGAEKKPAIAYTRRLIRWLDKLDMSVILICHQRDLWKNGECIGVTFDGWDKLDYELDLSMNIVENVPGSRNAVVTKSRLLGFPKPGVFPWSYEEFAKRYGKDVIEATAHKITLATPEQIKAITGLIEAVRVDQETIDKWYEKAGVTRFEEMEDQTIQKCIDHLTAKLPKNSAA